MFGPKQIVQFLKTAREIPAEQEAKRQRAWQRFAAYLLPDVPEQGQTYQFTRSLFEWLCYIKKSKPLTQEIGTLFVFLREHTAIAHLLYLYGMGEGVAYERRLSGKKEGYGNDVSN